MIEARFFHNNSGFEISGHADMGVCGSDILCAAVSSCAYMAANTITEILNVQADAGVSEGYLKLEFSADDFAAKAVVSGLQLHLEELQKDYPKKLKVTTEV